MMTFLKISQNVAHLLIGLTLAFTLSTCATNPVTGKKEFMLMSKSQEISMGKESDPSIVAMFGLYEDAKLQNFIDQKGMAMVKLSHRPDLPYDFKIVDSPVINAFAVPGGYVYFTRGIMAHFNNEAEFAGVLGHEIGHIAARHSAKQYSKSVIAQVGLVAGALASETFAQYANLASQGVALLFLKFGRDAERQSDKLGAEYSSKLGYDAQEMAGFFNTLDRMRQQSGQQIPNFLSTHPDPADRNEDVAKYASKWKSKLNLSNPEVGRESYLRMIDGLIYGDDPRQGYVENNKFYHPELKFQFRIPSGWATQNSPQQFQMAEPNGKAVMILSLSPQNNPVDAARAFAQQYELEVVQAQQVNVNGMSAVAQIADQLQDGQRAIRLLTYFISYGGTVYSILGATAYQDFNTYSNTFQATMTDFEPLSDPSKLNRQPTRLNIVEVKQTGTLETALRSYNTQNDKLQELALLNGMNLNDQVRQGMLIKTLE